ncbi:Lrp/AsnC family transcriptional regulator [Pseudoalteromonas sp. BSi20495]|uniref:Lrp/AsnC family transcriptional regulator n=1 Tax=Pseudoalteromonas sp. BSi20495 TaxID=386429 RepID=UPI0006ACD886|nr:Lrp/AsnC family transcriptional regulator [Pseudoalteromonas sp. BSi20495]
MNKDANVVQKKLIKQPKLDAKDRILLAILSEDASLSYTELGSQLHLSAPAVHERVKRLKKEGVIMGTVAKLDSTKIGRTLLAFIHIDTSSWAVTRSILSLKSLSEVEEIHTVAGDSAMLLKVRTQNTQSLEALLEVIHSIDGFTGTRSYIVLTPHLERGPTPLLLD